MKKLLASLLVFSSLTCAGCFFQPEKQEDTRFMMDTIVTITTTGNSKKDLTDATNDAMSLFQTIATQTDPYAEQGPEDLYAINQAAGQGPHKASPYLMDILSQVQPLQDRDLDLTLGPVIQVWNRHKEDKTVPTEAEIAQALAKCGPEKYTLDVAKNTVTLAHGAQLDLGAVAKGYAVEQTAELLRRDKRVKTALINAGGNIKVLGTKEDGSPWKIGVQNPRNPQKVLGTLAVKDGTAIATSGDYQRYYEVDGKRYHHILDPRTGWPAWNARSVTVVTHSAFWADYYSTLLFVLPWQKAMDLVEQNPDLEMLYVEEDGTIHLSSGLKTIYTPE